MTVHINIHILYCSLLQSKNNGILLNEMPPLPLEQPQTQTKYIVFECFPKYESQKPTEPEWYLLQRFLTILIWDVG